MTQATTVATKKLKISSIKTSIFQHCNLYSMVYYTGSTFHNNAFTKIVAVSVVVRSSTVALLQPGQVHTQCTVCVTGYNLMFYVR